MNIHNLIKLSYAIKREFNQQLSKFDLTFNQWLILKELNTKGAISAQELSHCLSSDKVTISQCLKVLENKGFIARVSNPQDKRSKLIEIQDSARNYCQEIKKIEIAFNNNLNEPYTEEQMQQFNKICEQSLNTLEGE